VIELGWIESAIGVGTITGGQILADWGGFKRRVLTGLSGLIGMGLGISSRVSSQDHPVTLPAYGIIG
jgi:hypothetical protein